MPVPPLRVPKVNYNIPRAIAKEMAPKRPLQSMPDDPDVPMDPDAGAVPPDLDQVGRNLKANSEAIYQASEEAGKLDKSVESGVFGRFPSYMTPKKMTLQSVDEPQRTSISRFSVLDGLRALHGDKMADTIGGRMVDANSGRYSLPFAGRLTPNPKDQLGLPAYLVHGDEGPAGAYGYHQGVTRMIYLPRAVNKYQPHVVPHEFYHSYNNAGRPLTAEQMIDRHRLTRMHPGELGLSESMVSDPQFLQGIADGNQAALGEHLDLLHRYSPDNDLDAHDEWFTDLTNWSHDMSSIDGAPRTDDYLESLFETLLKEPPALGAPDPHFQHGPRAGQPAYGHSRRQRSLQKMIQAPTDNPDLWKKTIREHLFRGGSTQDGHPRYPSV